jgi:hypothetical protein
MLACEVVAARDSSSLISVDFFTYSLSMVVTGHLLKVNLRVRFLVLEF